MQCEIISIGNELLIGDTVNTNASWIGRILTEAGLQVIRIQTIGDELDILQTTLRQALDSADLIIVTGGLGPTHDDITKKAVTDLFDCETILHEPTLKFIKEIFKKRNIPFTRSNYHQAEVPDCCEVLFNTQGTAPGMWFERERSKLAVLPGVPHEMKHLMEKKVMPKLKKHLAQRETRKTYYILTAGVGESTLSDEIIGDLPPGLDEGVDLAYLPDPQGVRLRLSTRGASEDATETRLSSLLELVRKRVGPYVVGEGKGLTLSRAVGELLSERELWIAVAESCTGGFVCNEMTDVAGSSRYFKGGVVAYSNEVKISKLDVSPETLEKYGAVSKEVALQMARGIGHRMAADIGISTTGIAGPGGGTRKKPVGTVWMGFWYKDQHFALRTRFSNDRLINKERTAAVVLETVRRSVLGIEEMPYGLKRQTA